MREVGRVAMGFFPTPPRVVEALASMIAPPSSGPYTVLDAGCGTAAAIVQLRDRWTETHPAAQVRLFGIESDRHRAKESARNIAAHPAGGACLWAAIEDSKPDRDVSMLFFNPPYDRIRGNVRMELLLYDLVAEWVIRGGILAFVLPDYVLADEGTGLPRALDRQCASTLFQKIWATGRYCGVCGGGDSGGDWGDQWGRDCAGTADD